MQRAPTLPSRDLATRALAWLARSMLAVLPRSLWPRLSLLMLAAISPLMALLVVSAVADGRRVREDAMNRVAQLAVLAAEQQDDMVQEVSSLLHVLARVPEIRLLHGPECDELLAAVAADYPKIAGLAVVGTDGIVTCNLNPAARGLSVADVIGAEPRAARRQGGWPRQRMRFGRGGTAGVPETPSLAPR